MKLILLTTVVMVLFGLLAADSKLPDWAQAANGKETNYVSEALQNGLITNSLERALLQAASVGEQNRPLMKTLGYVAKADIRVFGSVQYPGKKVEPTYTDYGYMEVQYQRMRLVFDATAQDLSKHIMVFSRFVGWPGMNNTCVVITDSKFAVLDWRESKQSDAFASATYDSAKTRLTVKCERRQGGMMDYVYDLKDNRVAIVKP